MNEKVNHNDIVLELTKDKLISILKNKFGKRECWSQFHWVVKDDINTWELEKISHLLKNLGEEKFNNLLDIKTKFTEASNFIRNLKEEESLEIDKTIEFPIIKGEGQYKVTKGFIDLIVHCKPIKKRNFLSYEKDELMEFIIEIKKEKDFEDFGNVLRQIKEYKEYYNSYGMVRWVSKIIEENNYYKPTTTFFCVLSTNIPEKVKKLFEEEKILCLEIKIDE
jgi:hypothetical protein